MFSLQVCAALVSGLALLPTPADFEWQPGYSEALAQAKAEKSVVFVAVDFEGEARCENFLGKLTKDKQVRALAAQTLNVVSADAVHRKKGDCKRFKGIECADHRRVMADLIEGILQVNGEGVLCTPQYIWLDGEANVLLSVPYEIGVDGLVWCFEAAQRMVDPEGAPAFSDQARPPRRLLMGRTFTAVAGDTHGRGMTPEELELGLDQTKSNFLGLVGTETLARIMFTDEKKAVEYVQKQLGFLLQGFARDRIGSTLHSMGALSPAGFWKAVEEFSNLKDAADRHEVAVALEQMGAADALKLAKRGLKKEKDASVVGAWVRAQAACGAKDKGTRKAMFKLVAGNGASEMRTSAAFAMGYLQRGDDVRAVWLDLMQGDSVELCLAAAHGAALARDELMIPALEKALEEHSGDEGNRAAIQRSLTVIRGGDLYPIQADVERVTGDDLARERIFFGKPVEASQTGESKGRPGGRVPG